MYAACALRSVARAHHVGRMSPTFGAARARASNPILLPKMSKPPVRNAIAMPQYLQARGRAPAVRRAYPRIAGNAPAGGFCTGACYPGCCFDDNGMVCCVTGGNSHVCVADCFSYRWPGQHSVGPRNMAVRR